MSKKFRIIAVLTVCVMMFSVVQPAFAWGDTEKEQQAAGEGAVWGWIGGAVLGVAASVFTLGAAVPVILAGAAAGGAAGMIGGGAYGGCNEEEKAWVQDKAVELGKRYVVDKVTGKVVQYVDGKVDEMLNGQQQPTQ